VVLCAADIDRPLHTACSLLHPLRNVQPVEHSNSRFESIRYANRFESIRFVKNRPFDSLVVMQFFLLIYTYGDSDVISMPAGFCRHVVGKTLINVFHCDSAEMGLRFVGKIVIIQTFS